MNPQTYTGSVGGFLFAIFVFLVFRYDSNKRFEAYREDIAEIQETFSGAMDKVVAECQQERKFCEARYQAVLEKLLGKE